PPLLFLFPHLWIVLARIARAGAAGKAVRLFPRLVAGEIARIRGFLEARRRYRETGAFERPAAPKTRQARARARLDRAGRRPRAVDALRHVGLQRALRALFLPDQRRQERADLRRDRQA